MTLSTDDKIRFYRNREKSKKVIISEIKKRKLILFGARSLNRQFPKFLRKQTSDFDVIAPRGNAKEQARAIEKKLDKERGGNFYVVEKGQFAGVYKIKRVLGKEGVVDVVNASEKVPFVKRKGVRVSTLAFEKRKIKQSLADKKSSFRHDKDRERRGRIKIFESLRKKRKVPVRRKVTRRVRRSPSSISFTFPRARSLF